MSDSTLSLEEGGSDDDDGDDDEIMSSRLPLGVGLHSKASSASSTSFRTDLFWGEEEDVRCRKLERREEKEAVEDRSDKREILDRTGGVVCTDLLSLAAGDDGGGGRGG